MLKLSEICLAHLSGKIGKRQHFLWGTSSVRGRGYYRFHKAVGKGNWRAYTERYAKPRELEAKQRLRYDCKPTYGQLKQALSWNWRLPKMVDRSTTASQVLDSFILFRDKHPKKVFHYINTLHRLTVVGGCYYNDWRLKMILSNLFPVLNSVVNKPRLASILSKLGCYDHLERLSPFLVRNLPLYSQGQLVLIANAFGSARIRDAFLLPPLLHQLRLHLQTFATTHLISLVESLAAMEISDHTFLSRLNKEVVNRPLTLRQSVQWLEALAKARHVDLCCCEVVCMQAQDALVLGRGYTTDILARLLVALRDLEIFNTHLVTAVAAHASQHGYDWKTGHLALVASEAAQLESNELAMVILKSVYESWKLLDDPVDVLNAARAATRLNDDALIISLAQKMKKLKIARGAYPVGELVRLLKPGLDAENLQVLTTHALLFMEFFEPRELLDLKKEFPKNGAVSEEVVLWAKKRQSEFTVDEWRLFLEM